MKKKKKKLGKINQLIDFLENDFAPFEVFYPISEKIYIATEMLSVSKEPVIHKVLPILFQLKSQLNSCIGSFNESNKNEICSQIVKDLISEIDYAYQFDFKPKKFYSKEYFNDNGVKLLDYEKTYGISGEMLLFLEACFYDPIFKEFTFMKYPSEVKSFIKNRVAAKIKEENIEVNENRPSDYDFFSAIIPTIQKSNDQISELDLYCKSNSYVNTKIADYWLNGAGLSFPKIRTRALVVLKVQPTSMSVERSFSVMGNTLHSKTSSMSHSTLEHLSFTNKNYQFCPNLIGKFGDQCLITLDNHIVYSVPMPPSNTGQKKDTTNHKKQKTTN